MFKTVGYVLKSHIENARRIFVVGLAHAKKQTVRTSLGFGWNIIKDIVRFSTFVMFRYLMGGSRQVEGMHFIIYIISGSVPWNFMSEVINGGSQAIKRNGAIIKSIRFPIVIVPTIEVVSIFIKRLFTLVVPFVVILIFGDITLFNPLLFLYYFVSMFMLMTSFNFISSAFVAVSEDFQQLYMALTKTLFFFLPILWSFSKISAHPNVIRLLKLNPMVYIITGFREAFVLGHWPSLLYSLYFWAVCLVLFCVGTFVQYKMRKYYADFM